MMMRMFYILFLTVVITIEDAAKVTMKEDLPEEFGVTYIQKSDEHIPRRCDKVFFAEKTVDSFSSRKSRMRAFRDYFLGYVLPQVVLEHLEMEHNICVGDPKEPQDEYSYMGTYKKVLSDVVTHHPDNFYVFAGGQKTFPPAPAMELNFVPIYPGKPSGALEQDEDDDEDEEGRKPILGGASDE
eukprot:g4079.t1